MPTTNKLRDRRKFLHDVFVTAIEGGIQYWAVVKKYHWLKPEARNNNGLSWNEDLDLDGFHAVLVPSLAAVVGCWGVWDDAEKDTAELTVDADVIRRGVTLFKRRCLGEIDSRGKDVPPGKRTVLREDHYWRQFLVAERTNGEDGDYDAEVADQILQFGLFGQAVYG